MDTPASVIILVADGARPDTLAAHMHDGALPALARLRDEGAFHTITTVFPSVTGPAYTPFLCGRHPGSVGLPGLRWYDRSRSTCGWPSYARSYAGIQMRHVDRDLDPTARTLFDLVQPSVGALSVIQRGLGTKARVGTNPAFALRTASTHFRGDVRGWLTIDQAIGDEVVRRIRTERPRFVFAALPGIDKASHAAEHASDIVREAMQIVDDVAARIRNDAEGGGYWRTTHLWIVSDHGHSPVQQHDDLADVVRALGFRVLAHPWVLARQPEVAVMVSGNAMAHLYLSPERVTRHFWSAGETDTLWDMLARALLERASVDLLLLPLSPTSCRIQHQHQHQRRGVATLTWTRDQTNDTYSYRPDSGDPLGVGILTDVSADEAYDATVDSAYPDALVQIAKLCGCARSGDLILSAAPLWDFRVKYEPIPHVSSHGALHREHMLVPLLTSHPTAQVPRRTVDVMPSAARILGIELGADGAPVEGRTFM